MKESDTVGVEIRNLHKQHYFKVTFFFKFFFSKYVEVRRKTNFCSNSLKPTRKRKLRFCAKTEMVPDCK